MKEINETLQTICQIFHLGNLNDWQELDQENGFRVFVFNSDTKRNLKYYYK